MPNNYVIIGGELYHHGIKGQKWGRRRYQNADGSLTPAGIKRYAKAGYAKDSYDSNKTLAGKIYDKITGSHGIHADIKYAQATKKQREERAKQYLAEKDAKRNTPVKKKARNVATKAAKKSVKALATVGQAYCYDQFLTGGMGTRAVKSTVKHTGRAVISAYVYAKGGRDIRWYD